MDIRKSFFLIICGLIVIASSGCAMKNVSETLEPDSIQKIKPGKNVVIHLNKRVYFDERGVFVVKMLVTDVNAKRIQGDYSYYAADNSWVRANVEVNVEDINSVTVKGKLLHRALDQSGCTIT